MFFARLPAFPVRIVFVLLAVLLAAAGPVQAGDAPRLSDPNDRIVRPDLSGLLRMRFLTTLDFPPFNFADAERRPAGFNVEIARALCAELGIEAKCEIQAMPWEELDGALDGLHGEAIIAGHRITAELRGKRAVSLPYFRFPARFVGRKDFPVRSSDMTVLSRGRKVAVVRGSAHEAMLKAWFPEAVPVDFADAAAAHAALMAGEADLVFGDGVTLSFWLTSANSKSCCAFISGPFMSDRFLGPGIAIVMRKENEQVMTAIDSALTALEEKGVYQEIFTRYFPLSPYADGLGAEPSAPEEGKPESPEQSG